jgi:hypothetical protein
MLGALVGAVLVIAAPQPARTFTLVNDAGVALPRVERALEAQARQLHRYWGTPLVRFAAGGWTINLQASSDGVASGSHSVSSGQPYANVQAGYGWTQIASHEMLEMLTDPWGDHRIAGRLAEVCDPVEHVGYDLDGITVSDFVLPAWFARGRGRFDEVGAVTRAFETRFGSPVAQA